MRTTLNIDDELLVRVKEEAKATDGSLTSLVEEALQLLLAQREQSPPEAPVELTVVDGNGLQPGVDLDDSAALLDLMEGIGGGR
jgi:hypothetical protein